jgi:cell division protein FtsB
MKQYAAILLILSALSAALISLVGDDSYSKMRSLEKSVELQHEKNLELTQTVQEMRGEVRGLRSDPRAIEKAARNELGLARPDEQVFVFEKRSTGDAR